MTPGEHGICLCHMSWHQELKLTLPTAKYRPETGRSCVISTNGFGRWALFDPVSVWIDSPAWNIWPQRAVASTLFKRKILNYAKFVVQLTIDLSPSHSCAMGYWLWGWDDSPFALFCPLHLLSKPKHRLRRHSRLEKRQIVWLHFHKQSILFLANLLLYLLWGLCSCEAEHCTPSHRASSNKTNSLTHIQAVMDDIYNIKMRIARNEL